MAVLPGLLPAVVFSTQFHRPKPRQKRSELARLCRSADGFTLVEVKVSIVILAGGLVALSAVLVSTSHGNQQSSAMSFMIDRAQTLVESIKQTAPGAVAATFDNTILDVTTEASDSGVWLENGLLTVGVDDTTPTLLVVTVTGTWTVGTQSGGLIIRTEIYNPGATPPLPQV